MRKSKFSEEQIIGILREAEASKTSTVCRKHGISEQTLYRWKAKYGGMDVSDAKRLRALEDENRRLKTMVADLALDKQMLEAVLQKRVLSLRCGARRCGSASSSSASASVALAGF